MTRPDLEHRPAWIVDRFASLLGDIRRGHPMEDAARLEFALNWLRAEINIYAADIRAAAEEGIPARILAAKQQSIDAIMTVFEKCRRS